MSRHNRRANPNMKDKPTPTKATAPTELQKEIFCRLISVTAADGKFDLGTLKGPKMVTEIGKHLRGVSELLAATFADSLPEVTE